MRQKIVAGNWKMNKTLQETEELIKALQSVYTTSNTEVIIAPTYVNLYRSQELLNSSKIKV
ncbi:MAG: triose-phosphate isomerase, partial [Flavobacteriaceae bacterium]